MRKLFIQMSRILFTFLILHYSFTIKANEMIDSLKVFVKNKDTDKIISLITSHPEVLENYDINRSSGFLIIAYSGLENAFRKSIELKKEFNFHEAIVGGKLGLIKKYLGNDINLKDKYSSDGFAPLSLAAFFNQNEIAKFLVENGANPNLQATNASKVNALHSAIAKENFELCELFIKSGVNINATQTQNVTALHSAVHRGNMELVALLVQNGAEINIKMENGNIALNIAEKEGHTEIYAYLKAQDK